MTARWLAPEASAFEGRGQGRYLQTTGGRRARARLVREHGGGRGYRSVDPNLGGQDGGCGTSACEALGVGVEGGAKNDPAAFEGLAGDTMVHLSSGWIPMSQGAIGALGDFRYVVGALNYPGSGYDGLYGGAYIGLFDWGRDTGGFIPIFLTDDDDGAWVDGIGLSSW